ncbi:MAG TPA: riboflavin synthase [Polyangia bacterium]|nr:riboflavin synthase [Polyangia bacterium]
MFTGLVEDVGRVEQIDALPSGQGRRLTLAARLLDELQPLGASLAVDGVCLTVTSAERGRVTVEAGPETLERTTLGELKTGAAVNLERPVRLGDRLGGHLVAGHVDGIGRIYKVRPRGEAIDVAIGAKPELLRYVVEKGSIAVDGISLTVNRVDGRGFEVSIIPHTQTATTLTKKRELEHVNLEVDLIGKYVEKLLAGYAPSGGGLTLAKLKESGYADE